MFGNGAISSGFPIFFEPIRGSLGLSYTQMSLVFSLARAEGGMGAPLVGWLVDKFGSRPLILFGGLTAGIGLMLLSFATEYWHLIVLFVGVISVGKTAGLGQTLMATVNQWFVRRKALALSTLMTAFAGGGAIVVPPAAPGHRLSGLAADRIHHRSVCGPADLAGSLRYPQQAGGSGPAARRRPALSRQCPASRRPNRSGQPPRAGPKRQRRRAGFYGAAGDAYPGFLVPAGRGNHPGIGHNSIIIHLFPLLAWKGVDEQTATIAASVMFFMAIPLRFLLGVAGGRFFAAQAAFLWDEPGGRGPVGDVAAARMAGADCVYSGTGHCRRHHFGELDNVRGLLWPQPVRQPDGGDERFPQYGYVYCAHLRRLDTGQHRGYEIVLATFAPTFVLSAVMFALARRPAHPGPSSATTASETGSEADAAVR